MKLLLIFFAAFVFAGCLRIPKATISQAKQTDLKSTSDQLLAGKYKSDSIVWINTDSLADKGRKMELQKIGIGSITISKKDSIIYYEQPNKMLSIRLYLWEKNSTFRYDYATVPRSFNGKKDEFCTAAKKINDRLYIYASKEPGVR